MNDDAALAINAVYTAVSILSDSVATLPLRCFKQNDPSRTIVDPPALISDPWPEGTVQDWLSQVMTSLTLRGNFYGEVADRDKRGFPSMVRPVHPDSVIARRLSATGSRAYWFEGHRVDVADVMHVPNLLIPGSFIGLNPVEYMRQSWALAFAAEKYGAQFFANSAMPTGVIEVGEDLTEEETLELARAWKMGHGGLGNAGLPAVLTGGAQFKAIPIAAADAMFLATRDFQRQEIAAFFRIPSHLMGQQDRTSSWGTGVEQMEIGYVINTLRPYLSKIEAYLTRMLPPGVEVKFDLRGRLRGDTTQRFSNYAMAINNGWLTPDEARETEDLPPLPDGAGATFWRPLNMGPIDKILDGTLTPAGSGGAGGGVDQSPAAPAPGAVSGP